MAETWNNIRYVLDRFFKVDIWAYAVVIWTLGNEIFGPNFWGRRYISAADDSL